jgi:hypothetical protein
MRQRAQLNVNMRGLREDPAARAKADREKQHNEFWAKVLPMVGTGVGAVGGGVLGALGGTALFPGAGTLAGGAAGALAGGTAGSQLGSAIGGAGGQYFQSQAEGADDDLQEQGMKREALMNALMMMRK